jgi:hypothetical protein
VLTIKNPLSKQEAALAADPAKWRGWFPATVIEAGEKNDKNGNPMIELLLAVEHGGETREYKDWLTMYDRGAEKLRHASEMAGVLSKYEAGEGISPDDFAGHACQVRLDIEKRRGAPDRSVLIDYRPAAVSGVVNLRQAVSRT